VHGFFKGRLHEKKKKRSSGKKKITQRLAQGQQKKRKKYLVNHEAPSSREGRLEWTSSSEVGSGGGEKGNREVARRK